MRRRNDRVAELEAELEQRLKELEQREIALKKISDAVLKNRPVPAAPQPPAEDHSARLQEIEAREAALKRIADVVERRRAEIDVTVREAEERTEAAEVRARELQEQLAVASAGAARVADLEAEVAQLRAELEAARSAPPPVPAAAPVAQPARRGLFGRRARAGEEPPPAVEPPVLLPPPAHAAEPEPEPEPAPASPPPPAFEGRPTLPQLEHVAAEAERGGRPEAEEWLVYVALLREHAWMDGTIPSQFDDILRDVFGAAF